LKFLNVGDMQQSRNFKSIAPGIRGMAAEFG
jgi:hypothetical protein